MQTILLTWWTWYIWSHAAVVFLEAWYNIVIIDNLSNSSEDVIEKINTIVSPHLTSPLQERDSTNNSPLQRGARGGRLSFYKWDLRNKSDIEKVFQENTIDWVIHFAWAKAVWESCDKPAYYWENNVAATGNLVEIMDKYNCKNIIFSSSATVYDPAGTPPFSEKSKTGWDISNPYWTNKYVIEHMLRDMSNHRGFNSICLRYFNPVWAHESGLIWEDPNDIPNNLLPFIMKVASWELQEIKIFWDDYDTIDWTGVRDYIHVVDLVEGHLKAWEAIHHLTSPLEERENTNIPPSKGGLGGAGHIEYINLWTGNWTSVLEMVNHASEIVWKPLPYSIIERRTWDLASSYCIAHKAKKILNWEAKLSVKQAIKDSWNFIQKKGEM